MGAGDGDDVVFHGLAERLEDAAAELWEFVEEEDAAVGEADLAGPRDDASADDGGCGGGVVGRADGAVGDEGLARLEGAGGGVDAGDLDGFVDGEGWEDAGEGLGHHGLAGAGGAEHEEVVASRSGDGDGSLAAFLSSDFGEVDRGGGGGEHGVDVRRGLGLGVDLS